MGVISNLKLGEQVHIRLFLKSCDVRKTNTRPPRDYLSTVFTDGNDDLDGKVWNYVNAGDLPESKKCYDIVGTIGEYNNKKQITLTKMTLAANQDLTAFTANSGFTADELWAACSAAIASIENEVLHDICKTIYDKHKANFIMAPSASGIHHAYAGGNILHTIEVFNMSIAISELYDETIINRDLCKAGALLHDIGKAYTYDVEGPSISYTYLGHLQDHIVIGTRMLLDNVWPEAYNDIIELLIHIISAHHGKLEYGSPVTPKFLEAYIVNIADGISATFDTVLTANEKAASTSDVTEKIYACGNYQHITQRHIHEIVTKPLLKDGTIKEQN